MCDMHLNILFDQMLGSSILRNQFHVCSEERMVLHLKTIQGVWWYFLSPLASLHTTGELLIGKDASGEMVVES